jgi:hypothetical protein
VYERLPKRAERCPKRSYTASRAAYIKFSAPPIAGARAEDEHHSTFGPMLRYILAFAFLAMLGTAAFAAAIAAGTPTFGQIAFVVCLGLFVAALAGGVMVGGNRDRE